MQFLFLLSLALAGLSFSHATPIQKRADTSYGPNMGGSRDAHNWMAGLPDTMSLKDMSIPGTHDTMTYSLPDAGREIDFVKCQTKDLNTQLNSGIRYIDIRLQHSLNQFFAFHSQVPTGATFADVLNTLNAFLTANPKEAVLMRIHHEKGFPEKGNTRSFADTFNWYRTTHTAFKAHGYNFNGAIAIPTLGQMRGKFLILQNFEGGQPSWGIAYSNSNAYMTIEDYYSVTDANTKWDKVNAMIKAAMSNRDGRLWITYTSASTGERNADSLRYTPYYIAMGFPGVKIPFAGTKFAYDGMNKRTLELLQGWSKAAGHKKTGVVVMDYAGQGLIDAIRNQNLSK